MSGDGEKQIGQVGGGDGRNKPPYTFMVDGAPYESDVPVLTGQQIKARAGVDASFGLFLEVHGRGSDEQIGDSQTVDLREPGREQFYTAPPATYGMPDRSPENRG